MFKMFKNVHIGNTQVPDFAFPSSIKKTPESINNNFQ